MPWALVFALLNAGRSMLARIAIIAMTTSSSIKVKPEFFLYVFIGGIVVLDGWVSEVTVALDDCSDNNCVSGHFRLKPQVNALQIARFEKCARMVGSMPG